MSEQARRQQLWEIAGACRAAQAHELEPLIAAVRDIHGESVQAVIYYGSCLRRGDPYAGLVDLYVIVDDYRRAHRRQVSAWLNALLPPNVYYLERAASRATLRAKYAVLSLGQLERGAARWFQSAVWGRFAQPVAVVYARVPRVDERVRLALGQATLTLMQRALPALPEVVSPEQAFAGALALSYACELRVEGGTRSAELVAEAGAAYRHRFQNVLPLLPYAAEQQANGGFRFRIPSRARRRSALAWSARRAQGKLLSLLRLSKASLTFGGGVDYAAWKLERHSGAAITVTPRVRRHPLIFGWGLLWRLYRQGLLR